MYRKFCFGSVCIARRSAGVAYPSLIARAFSAVVITILCFQKKNDVSYEMKWLFHWDGRLLKKILGVAVPNGIENGVFQLVKVALSSIVALIGTYEIAANGVAQSIWSMSALAAVSMGPVFITVIGQCMGNRNIEAADYILGNCETNLMSCVEFVILFMTLFLHSMLEQNRVSIAGIYTIYLMELLFRSPVLWVMG